MIPEENTNMPKRIKSKRSAWENIGIAFTALLVIALIVLTPTILRAIKERRQVNHAMSGYAAALAKKDYPKAYAYLSDELKQGMPLSEFSQQQASLDARFGPLQSIKRQTEDIEGAGSPIVWVARIEVDHNYQRRSVRFAYEWHQQGGRWVLWSCEPKN